MKKLFQTLGVLSAVAFAGAESAKAEVINGLFASPLIGRVSFTLVTDENSKPTSLVLTSSDGFLTWQFSPRLSWGYSVMAYDMNLVQQLTLVPRSDGGIGASGRLGFPEPGCMEETEILDSFDFEERLVVSSRIRALFNDENQKDSIELPMGSPELSGRISMRTMAQVRNCFDEEGEITERTVLGTYHDLIIQKEPGECVRRRGQHRCAPDREIRRLEDYRAELGPVEFGDL